MPINLHGMQRVGNGSDGYHAVYCCQLAFSLSHRKEWLDGFDYAEKHIPGLSTGLKYFSIDNFVG
jgi:hypothetical protein